MNDTLVVFGNDETVAVENTETVVISQLTEGPQGPPGSQGPPGPPGPAGSGTGPAVRVLVPSGETSIIQEFDASIYRTIKWIVTLTNPILGTVRSFELLALNHSTHCSHVVYGIIGDSMQYSVDVQLINTQVTLLLTNAETNDLIVDAVRIGSISIT